MKILIVNSRDLEGGAARAAYRLHKGLQIIGIDSQMLVQIKTSDDYAVIAPTGKISRFMASLRSSLDKLPLLNYPKRNGTLFSSAIVPYSGIAEKINQIAPDIVHLHWVAGGFIRIEDLLEINAPIIWSMHDDWLLTGGCHIKWTCRRWIDGCGCCPVLGSDIDKDLSHSLWLRKKKIFSRMPRITVIGLSRWLADSARQSPLLQKHNIVNLPNMIDTSVYRPLDKNVGREILGLPEDKKLVMFGAMHATFDVNKGYPQLLLALGLLDRDDIELVVFGSSRPMDDGFFLFKSHYLGRLHDDATLRVLYSAADVMVVPSLQENLSNAIMESLACGTPVVAFDVGGNSDLVDHLSNGYLAKAIEPDDLARGINWVLDHEEPILLSSNAVKKVRDNFSVQVVARKYEQLYRQLLVS